MIQVVAGGIYVATLFILFITLTGLTDRLRFSSRLRRWLLSSAWHGLGLIFAASYAVWLLVAGLWSVLTWGSAIEFAACPIAVPVILDSWAWWRQRITSMTGPDHSR